MRQGLGLGGVHLGHADQKFFAAPAHHHITLTHHLGKAARHFHQHHVAHGVAVAVVDVLEVVDIHQQQRAFKTLVLPTRGGGFVQAAAVAQAGQWVHVALGAQEGVVVFQAAVDLAHAPVHQRHQRGGQRQHARTGQPDLLQRGAVVQLGVDEPAFAGQQDQPALLGFAVKTLAQLGQRGVAVGGHHLCGQVAFTVKKRQRRRQVAGRGKGVSKLVQRQCFVSGGAAVAVDGQQAVQHLARGARVAQRNAGQRRVVRQHTLNALVVVAACHGQRFFHSAQGGAGLVGGHQHVGQVGQVRRGQALRTRLAGQHHAAGGGLARAFVVAAVAQYLGFKKPQF